MHLMRIFAAGLTVLLLLLQGADRARADVFVLDNGGRVVGELLNPDESPRKTYVIRTPAGAEITLERSQIKQILHPRPEEIEYEKIRPRYPDTVQGQWDLAQWCLENGLRQQRKDHLQRVIELDPDHADARRALGYSRFDGKWKTYDQIKTDQGFVLYKGHWRLPQEVQLLQEKEKIEVAEKTWMQKLERLLSNASNDHQAIAAINDPFAVKALAKAMHEDPRDQIRLLLAEVLGRIGTNPALQALAESAIKDSVPEVRLTCIDQLKKRDNAAAVDYFVGWLSDKRNDNKGNSVYINRAAEALKEMGNASAIGPLIDALVTSHKRIIQQGGSGQMSATFSPQGGSGMTMGGGPRVERFQLQNRAVLDALISLSGDVNFGFDIRAWKGWYAAQKRQSVGKLRRD